MDSVKDFDFVLRVLRSCETYDQLKTSDNLYNIFKNKWKNEFDEEKTCLSNRKWNKERDKVFGQVRYL
jgi:hypothetical protein